MTEVLYRKYRPQKFQDVLGQDQIVKVLEAQVANGKISHAYLFAGTRGTGKTSVARILADALGTTGSDIYEIDAASNTGVDDIRSLNDSIQTLPFNSKYKVYILDEVHMLSKSAGNALLKTLEEPPPYVVFILATTEIHKIPETVLSRCEVYTFKKPSVEVLKKDVQAIAKKEGFNVSAESTELIALLGDGSFRDTLGILQKIISVSGRMENGTESRSPLPKGKATSASGREISDEEIRLVTGAPKRELVESVVSAISEKNLDKALSTIQTAQKENIDIAVFLKLILRSARAILLLRFGAGKIVEGELSEKEFKFLSALAESDKVFSSQVLIELLTALELTTGAHIASLPLELALVNIIREGK
jgi:DNA polymerase-3 subunit gamma/tau